MSEGHTLTQLREYAYESYFVGTVECILIPLEIGHSLPGILVTWLACDFGAPSLSFPIC